MVSPTTDRRLGLVGNTPYKSAATVVATANVTRSGQQTIDGVALLESNAAGVADRVLCIGQTTTSQNGPWDVSTGSWTRPKDANGNFDLANGSQIIVTRGSHAYEIYTLATADPITIDTTAQVWQPSLSAGSLATLAAGGGAALVGFLQAGSNAVLRTVESKLRDTFSVKDYGALGDGATNDYTAIQNLLEYVNSIGGGTIYFPVGDYRHSLPLKTYDNIRLIGSSRLATKLTKTGSGTINVGAPANAALVCLGAQAMGDGAGNINSSIWISSAIRALNVEIAHLTIRSLGTAATTAPVDIGIAGIGASDSSIHDNTFEYFKKAAVVLPVMFFGEVYNNKAYRCVQGFAYEAGTSLNHRNNYAIYCQKVGHYFRDMYYLKITNNACDGLNNISNASDYTDRTIDSKVYVLDACNGVGLENNGAEQCFGSHVYIDSCNEVNVEGNSFNSPASSYTGANQVAIFYVNSLAHGVTVARNFVFRNGATAIQGAANAANHHDCYVNVASENHGFRWKDNWFCNTKFDAPTAIYGNMIPAYLSQLKQGAELAGDWTPTITLVSATGVGITYGATNKGRYSISNGWMYVDAGIHLATSTYGTTTAFPELHGLPFPNRSAKSARLVIDQSTTNFIWPTTEPYYCDLLLNLNNGTFRSRNDTSLLNAATAFPSGTTDVYFHMSGMVYVGDVVNVVTST